MMDDFIKRSDAISALKLLPLAGIMPETVLIEAAIGAVRNVEKSDVVERRECTLSNKNYDEEYTEFGKCSNCGYDIPTYSKFCCMCGFVVMGENHDKTEEKP